MVLFGLIGLVCTLRQQAQAGSHLLGDDRQSRRSATGRPATQNILDYPVLETLVGLHDQASTHSKASKGPGKRPFEDGQLVVDGDAQRLEGALGRVTAGAPRGGGDRLADNVHELPGARDRRSIAATDDEPSDTRRKFLFAVGAQDSDQFTFRGRGQQIGCTGTGG